MILTSNQIISDEINDDFQPRSLTSVSSALSPLQKDLEFEDHTSSPIREMSPGTQELYDVLIEPGMIIDDELVTSPDITTQNNIYTLNNDSETDCESCDVPAPNNSNDNKMDNVTMQNTILLLENQKETAEIQTNKSNTNTSHTSITAASTSGK